MRTVFFISDGTGITAETVGHSLLSQFEGTAYRQERIPFIDTLDKARECRRRIEAAKSKDGVRSVVVTTLVDPVISAVIREADALHLDFIATWGITAIPVLPFIYLGLTGILMVASYIGRKRRMRG